MQSPSFNDTTDKLQAIYQEIAHLVHNSLGTDQWNSVEVVCDMRDKEVAKLNGTISREMDESTPYRPELLTAGQISKLFKEMHNIMENPEKENWQMTRIKMTKDGKFTYQYRYPKQ